MRRIIKHLLLLNGSGGIPAISVTGDTDFDSTPVGTPVSEIFTIENTGTAPLTITSISVPSGFTLTDPAVFPFTIAVGGTDTFTVQADAGSVAVFSGNISIASNAAGSPTLVAIAATVTILLTNIGVWWDAASPSTLWEDSARTIQAADDGDVLGAVDDKSGRNLHALQATTANKPLLQLAEINANNAIQFATDDWLAANLANGICANGNFTIYVVWKTTTTNVDVLYAESSTASATPFFLVRVNQVAVGSFGFTMRHDAGGIAHTMQFDGDYNNGNPHIGVVTRSGDDWSIRVDGVLRAGPTTQNKGATSVTRIGMGAELIATPAQFFDGFIPEIIAYDRAHTAQEIAYMESYLNTKWGAF